MFYRRFYELKFQDERSKHPEYEFDTKILEPFDRCWHFSSIDGITRYD